MVFKIIIVGSSPAACGALIAQWQSICLISRRSLVRYQLSAKLHQLNRQSVGFVSLEVWVQFLHEARLNGGSSMAEQLTENQQTRVRFSPLSGVWQNGDAALLKSVSFQVIWVQIPSRPILLKKGASSGWLVGGGLQATSKRKGPAKVSMWDPLQQGVSLRERLQFNYI